MSNFQIILIGLFIVFIIGGALTFASFGGLGGATSPLTTVTLWGTLPHATMEAAIKQYNVNATYVEKNPQTIETEFTEALAENKGPDLIIFSQDQIVKQKNKLFAIPYANYPENQFKDTFVDEGSLFLTDQGTLGLPLLVDPLVMYWNRDTFSSAGIANPPKSWDEFYTVAPQLTKKNDASVISTSFVAFGEYSNVSHMKDILATLIMQAGNPIIVVKPEDGTYLSVLTSNFGSTVSPAEAALNFYTSFADPTKPYYSWNKSLPESKQSFINGSLAVYFGFASEYDEIHNKNPNLNFDSALVPQPRDSTNSITFGRVAVLSMVKNTVNKTSALAAMNSLTSAKVLKVLSTDFKLPPARRDLLATPPTQGSVSRFYTAAIQSRGWLDPDSVATDAIFQNMVKAITTGVSETGAAVSDASDQITQILRRYAQK